MNGQHCPSFRQGRREAVIEITLSFTQWGSTRDGSKRALVHKTMVIDNRDRRPQVYDSTSTIIIQFQPRPDTFGAIVALLGTLTRKSPSFHVFEFVLRFCQLCLEEMQAYPFIEEQVNKHAPLMVLPAWGFLVSAPYLHFGIP